MRESPSLKLNALLRPDGAGVTYHDPRVPRFHGLDMDSPGLTSVMRHARLVVDLCATVVQTLAGSPRDTAAGNVGVL